MIAILKERVDLTIVILGKTYLWTCRCKRIKLIYNQVKRIVEIKYETEKYMTFKANKISQCKKCVT